MVTTFNITPIGKPRMTQSDRWKKRPATMKYWEYKDRLNIQAKLLGFKVPECLEILFVIPMPDSWSEKKKAAMEGEPHQQKIDIDNAIKGFFDALCIQDNFIYYCKAMKILGRTGKIVVETSGLESVINFKNKML
jgi:Holliday junction resolvase RusA-like endonuclease